MQIKVMCFGDVVGKIGRLALRAALPELKTLHTPDLVVVNVENLAHGHGVTPRTLDDLKDAGIDVFTSGHHVWENPLGLPVLRDPASRLIRPANAPAHMAGIGHLTVDVKGVSVTILNLQGQLFMSQEVDSPFTTADILFRTLHGITVIDFHTETTAEKEAFGRYVDGRASFIFGTHTHVPTADARILPKGTGYLTDVGMCGAHDSVIGFEINSSIKRFLDPNAPQYDLEEHGRAEVNGVCATIDTETGKTLALDQIRRFVEI